MAYYNWPRYVVLKPPVPDNVIILSEEKKISSSYSTGNVKFGNDKTWTWRRKYDFPHLRNDSYTLESALAYFDTWLNEHDWEKFNGPEFLCDGMTEVDSQGKKSTLITYTPKNAARPYTHLP